MARRILANSPGWKFTGPMLTQMRAPKYSRPMPGTSGQQQQGEAEEADGPAVALEVADPANQHERDDERGDADRHPRRLQPGQVLRLGPGRVEADDEHVAEPVQQPGDRQERAVGVRARGGGWRRGRRAGAPAPRRGTAPMSAGMVASSAREART